MKLSDFEIELMQFLWNTGQSSAPELHVLVQEHKEVTYSTVKTIVDRLEKKGAIFRSAQKGRTIYYQAKVQREEITKPLVKGFIHRMFAGKSMPLVSQLLEDETLNAQDIDYLEQLLAEKKSKLEDKS